VYELVTVVDAVVVDVSVTVSLGSVMVSRGSVIVEVKFCVSVLVMVL
jgi:hypothetical protein